MSFFLIFFLFSLFFSFFFVLSFFVFFFVFFCFFWFFFGFSFFFLLFFFFSVFFFLYTRLCTATTKMYIDTNATEWSLKQKLKGRFNKLLHFTISLKYTEVLQNTYTDSLNIYYRNSYRTRLCKVAHLPLVANGISMRRGYGRRHSRLKLSCVGQQGCSFSPAIPRYPLASGIALYTITPFYRPYCILLASGNSETSTRWWGLYPPPLVEVNQAI